LPEDGNKIKEIYIGKEVSKENKKMEKGRETRKQETEKRLQTIQPS
jgi:hypothetical protein